MGHRRSKKAAHTANGSPCPGQATGAPELATGAPELATGAPELATGALNDHQYLERATRTLRRLPMPQMITCLPDALTTQHPHSKQATHAFRACTSVTHTPNRPFAPTRAPNNSHCRLPT
ncbi:hypothetical protein BU15DRAFT_63834 [Melanogaster broomeanus]|nr:hypothetical protein BU15DRAFT_63834 [Melanogaster broomeanus]